MNRFLRSAHFPVVVITLIVWLGTQTLIGHKSPAKKVTTSEVIQTARELGGRVTAGEVLGSISVDAGTTIADIGKISATTNSPGLSARNRLGRMNRGDAEDAEDRFCARA